jgi:hypothetical protein
VRVCVSACVRALESAWDRVIECMGERVEKRVSTFVRVCVSVRECLGVCEGVRECASDSESV